MATQILSTDLPTREDRLSKLGLAQVARRDLVQTGYLRWSLDTNLNGGWLKQVEISEPDNGAEAEVDSSAVSLQIGLAFKPGISILRVAGNDFIVGTQKGLVHVIGRHGTLRETYHVGDASVSDLLVTGEALKGAYCAGRLTLFDNGDLSGTTELPEYFVDLADCGSGVLAWKRNSLWVTEPSG